MTILGFDITSATGSIALRRNGSTALKGPLHSADGFAHVIFGIMREFLAETKCHLEEIDCFAAASGPGSFTGVRVGLSVVKGLAEAEGKPALGVSNLRALASFGKTGQRAVYLDARRNEFYGAIYDSDLNVILPEQVFTDLHWIPSEAEVIRGEANQMLAGAVAYCAELDWSKNPMKDPAALDANYVRRSDAELFWKDDSR